MDRKFSNHITLTVSAQIFNAKFRKNPLEAIQRKRNVNAVASTYSKNCAYRLLWFNFILGLNFILLCFKLIIIHYHTQKQRKIQFKLRIKLNHNTDTRHIHQNEIALSLTL